MKAAEAVSSEKYIKFGTPQGTLLGPILFLIFINSFCDIQLENGEITTYADDTAITFYGANLREVFDFANTGLNRLKRHLDRDLLSINYDKSKYILFGFKSIIVPPELTLQMHKTHNVEHCDCPEIKQNTSIKYLGVVIDSKLSWQEHIDATTKKIRKLYFKFHHLKYIMNLGSFKSSIFCIGTINYTIRNFNKGWRV